jgi:predicted RNase H-like HicB family nuclease
VKRIIQVRIFRSESLYVGERLDLPAVTQASTLDELARNIPEAVALHLEGEDLATLGLGPDPTILASIELEAIA